MKTQLILLATPIIVSNEAVKLDEWCIEIHNGPSLAPKTTPKFTDGMGNTWWLRQMNMNCQANDPECKKVIAGLPKFPSIDFNGFEEQLGIIDVNKLAKEKCKEIDDFGFSEKGFIEGFKAAQKLNEKNNIFEDLNVLLHSKKHCFTFPDGFREFQKSIIDYLTQPKVFDIEVEMEDVHFRVVKSYKGVPVGGESIQQPKITNNSIKIIKVL